VWSFRDTDLDKVGTLLKGVGGAAALILLPQFMSLFTESLGWRLAFEKMGRPVPLLGLFRVRVATEALAQTLPMGVVFCESMKPVLLGRHCGTTLQTSLAGMAARKWLLLGSQSVYIGGFALLGFGVLNEISHGVIGAPGLPFLVMAAALLSVAVTAVSFAVLSRGRVATRLYELLIRVRIESFRRALIKSHQKFAETDGELQRFFATAFSPVPNLAFLGGWLFETIETVLILRLLGVDLTLATIGAMEVSASFLRNIMFVVPAGLGVQDLGYLTFLRALGVPDALNVAAAFLVLKRAKEAFWAAVGYGLLALDLRSSAPLRARIEMVQHAE
jgi:uncharacterized membrane protein YbhN (UPF0104 family)